MVDKITLFEPHFDGAHIGPVVGGDDSPGTNPEATGVESDGDETSSGGIRRIFGILALALVLVGVAYVIRQRASHGSDEFETTEAEPISVDQ